METKNRLFAWDEISTELSERNPEDWFRTAAEGGWTTEGWYSPKARAGGDGSFKYGLPVVEVSTQGRHAALATWCETWQEAHELFMEHDEYAAQYEADAAIEEDEVPWVAMAWHRAEHDDPENVLDGCLLVVANTHEQAEAELIGQIRTVGDDEGRYHMVIRRAK
jgi:hypothetical protein